MLVTAVAHIVQWWLIQDKEGEGEGEENGVWNKAEEEGSRKKEEEECQKEV